MTWQSGKKSFLLSDCAFVIRAFCLNKPRRLLEKYHHSQKSRCASVLFMKLNLQDPKKHHAQFSQIDDMLSFLRLHIALSFMAARINLTPKVLTFIRTTQHLFS